MQNNSILLSPISIEDLGRFIEEKVTKAVEKITFLNKNDGKSLYTRQETANLLGVSLTTLFHWNNQGILNARKIGRKVFYSKDEVLAQIQA